MADRHFIDTAVVEIRADLQALRADLAKGGSLLQSSLKGFQTLALSLAPVLTIGGLVALGKSFLDLGDKLSDLHDKTGLSIEVLGGLKPIIDQTDSSIEQFATGILKAQKNLGGIHSEADPAALALKTLGLNVKDMLAASPDEFLERFAKGLATLDDRNKRAAIATQILGRAGAELIPIILQIAERGLPRLSSEAAAGFKALGDLKDAMVRVTGEAANFWAAIFGRTVGALSFSQTDALKRQIESLSVLLVGFKIRMGDAFETDPKMRQLQAWLTGLQVTLEKLSGAAAPAGAKPDGGLGPDPAKVQNAIESLEKQIAALHAQKIALEQGEQAALRYRLSQQLMVELGVKKLPPEIQKVIEKLIAQSKALEIAKFQSDRLDESVRRLDQDLAELTKGAEELNQAELEKLFRIPERFLEERRRQLAAMFDADSEELARGRQELGAALNKPFEIGDQLTVRLREISIQAGLFGHSFDGTAERINAVQSAMSGFVEIIARGLPGADDARNKLAALKDQLDGLKNLQAVENAFDSAFSGIQQTLQGVLQGTQTLGEGMKNVFRNVALSISESLLKINVIDPLKTKISGLLSESFPSLFGGTASAAGTAASGATLQTAGVSLSTAGVSLNTAAAALSAAAAGMGAGGLAGAGGIASVGTGMEQIAGPDSAGGGIFGGIGEKISGMFSGLMESLSSMLSGLMDMLTSAFSGLGDMLSSLLSSLGGGLSSMFSGIGSFIMGLFETGGFVGLGGLPSFAAGGAVPILAHPGEFVMRSAAVRSIGHGTLSEANRTGKFPEGGGQAGGPIHLHITHDYTNAVAPSDLKTKRKEVETYVIENWRKGGAVRTVIMGDKGHK